jgi:hypothetical protein
MCDTLVITVPWILYIAATIGMSFRAFLDRVERAPGLFWQFDKASYNDVGWKWHKRSMWMLAGVLPFVGLLMLVSHSVCPN